MAVPGRAGRGRRAGAAKPRCGGLAGWARGGPGLPSLGAGLAGWARPGPSPAGSSVVRGGLRYSRSGVETFFSVHAHKLVAILGNYCLRTHPDTCGAPKRALTSWFNGSQSDQAQPPTRVVGFRSLPALTPHPTGMESAASVKFNQIETWPASHTARRLAVTPPLYR